MLTLDTPVTITGATAANPVVITAASHGFSNGDEVRITDVLGMTELNNNCYTVANQTGSTFELTSCDDGSNINGSAYTAYISGGVANKKVTAISGFTHLEGETVSSWGDGAIIPDEVVSSGAFTIDTASSVVQSGLPYTHTLKTLKVVGGNPAGTPVGKTKRIYKLTFVLLNSHTVGYGPNTSNLMEADFRVVSDPMDTGVTLFTGEKLVEFEGDYVNDPRIIIQSNAPCPFTLLALAPDIQVNPLT